MNTVDHQPLISIIVPVLNMELTVARTLQSIVEQKYPQVEIIVVDGASSDSTLEEVDRYSTHLAHVISESDDGLYYAVNKGLERARGEIVGILNGDDYYAHSRVLDLYADQFDEPDTGIVFGDLEFFAPGKPEKTIRTYSSHKFTKDKLRLGWMPPHPTTLVRRSVYDSIGNYSTDYRIAADFDFLIRAVALYAVKFQRVDSVVVRMQYGGLSTRGLIATYTLNREIILACRRHGLKTNWPTIMLKFPQKLLEFAPALRLRQPHIP